MRERALTLKMIAKEKLFTSENRARAILAVWGLSPINYGVGTYDRLRWLESSVDYMLTVKHAEAQPQPKKPRVLKPRAAHVPLADMKNNDVYNMVSNKLTNSQRVQ